MEDSPWLVNGEGQGGNIYNSESCMCTMEVPAI